MKEIEELADTVKVQLNLEYNEASVEFVEGFIERNKLQIEKENWDGLINSLGAFLGQCIIENYGGKWEFDEETQATCVAFDNKNKVYPFAKVSKQFENGLAESISSLYRNIPIVFKLLPNKKTD
jgi:hypothetical protein